MKRFSNTSAISSSVQRGFFLRKKPRECESFEVERLENR